MRKLKHSMYNKTKTIKESCPYDKNRTFPKKIGSSLCLFNCKYFMGVEKSNGNDYVHCLRDESLKEDINYKMLLTEKKDNIFLITGKQQNNDNESYKLHISR